AETARTVVNAAVRLNLFRVFISFSLVRVRNRCCEFFYRNQQGEAIFITADPPLSNKFAGHASQCKEFIISRKSETSYEARTPVSQPPNRHRQYHFGRAGRTFVPTRQTIREGWRL